MTDEEFAGFLALNREISGVEFKGPGPRTDRRLFTQVVRAVLAMVNRRDGGIVIVGVEDVSASPNPVGLSDADLATWTYNDVADGIAIYADPSVSFGLEVKEHNGKKFVVIEVAEFEDVPVLCKRQYPGVLREGACYVRTRRKPETSEIPTQAEMRDLLNLATEKGVRRYIEQLQRLGIIHFGPLQPDDEELFNQQLEDLR